MNVIISTKKYNAYKSRAYLIYFILNISWVYCMHKILLILTLFE